MVIAPKTEHGMKARYRCKDGYVLAGDNVTECLYGEWTGDTPLCNQSNAKSFLSMVALKLFAYHFNILCV